MSRITREFSGRTGISVPCATPKLLANLPGAGGAEVRGFTLIELLAVIGLLVLVLGLGGPVFSSLFKAKGVSRAVSDLSSMIELARGEAMAKNTYVWLGFQNAVVHGDSQLWVAAVRSLDGGPALSATNTRMIGKIQVIENTSLVERANLGAKTLELLGQNVGAGTVIPEVSGSLAKVQPGLELMVSGIKTQFVQFVTFTPQGEALLSSDPASVPSMLPFTNLILIGLRQTVGTRFQPGEAGSVALLLYGGTGQVKALRM